MRLRNGTVYALAGTCGLYSIVQFCGLICVLLYFLPNLGFEAPWYYYGAYNSAKHVLESRTDIEIVDSWQHQDIGLESFSFDLVVDGKTRMTLMFPETLTISRETDKEVIEGFVDEQIASNKVPEVSRE